MKKIRRGFVTMALTSVALLAVPAVANADTLVYNGTTSDGKYSYTNANTGGTIISATYLGATFETSGGANSNQCKAVE